MDDCRWVVLFGGAGREGVVLRMVQEGVPVDRVIVPASRSEKLNNSIDMLRASDVQVTEVSRSDLAGIPGEIGEDELEHICLLSVGFPYIIPEAVFSRFKMAWNVHPTLLPAYRGPTSGAYVLINGEEYSGSTVHVMESEMDAGAIVAQKSVPLSPFDTIRSMQRKIYAIEPDLIMEALDNARQGKSPVPQDESRASSYPRSRTPEDSVLDPGKPLLELVNHIRACDVEKYPAFFYYHGQKVYIRLWREDKPECESDCI